MSVPSALIVFAALMPGAVLDLVPVSSIPVAMVVMALSQLAGWWIGRASDAKPIARICLMNLIVLTVVLPILALQASAARVPYVSTELGTATPAIVATAVAVAAIVAAAIIAVATAWDGPDTAGLLFAPVSLFVPVMLGGPYDQPVDTFVDRIRDVFAVMVVLTVAVNVMPRFSRLLAPPAVLAMLFVGLWLLDRDPRFQPTSGEVVRILDSSLLAISVILLVAVPIASIGIRRIELEMRRPVI